MIKEFNNELQAKAIAESLGLFMTKYRGVYLVSNSKDEMLTRYNLGYHQAEDIFYDKEVFKEDGDGFIVIRDKFLVDAAAVELPYGLEDCSYMFWACISLEIPPIIPESVEDCTGMFQSCKSLKEHPYFPKNCTILNALKDTPFERGQL